MNPSLDEIRALLAQERARLEDQAVRIAARMHDDISQRLTVLTLELALLQSRLPQDGAETSKVTSLLEQIVGINKAVRNITTELRPKILEEFGLVAALQAECRRMASESGVKVELNAELPDISLPPGTAIEVFRIVQGISSVLIVHAKATEISVGIQYKEKALSLSVIGVRRKTSDERWKESSVLEFLGLQERALWLGGSLLIQEGAGVESPIAFILTVQVESVTISPTRSRGHI